MFHIAPSYNSGSRINIEDLLKAREDLFVANSTNGWIDEKIKVEWFDQVLLQIDRTKRHLFICDGHVTNLTIELLKKAQENNVDILAFPSHSTTLLQPLDVLPFQQLKKAWKQAVHEFVQTHDRISKGDFLQLIRGPLHHAHNPGYIEKAFLQTGIHPLDPSQVTKKISLSKEEKEKALEKILTVPKTMERVKSVKKYLTREGKLLSAVSVVDLLTQEKEDREKEKQEKEARKKENAEKKKIKEDEKEEKRKIKENGKKIKEEEKRIKEAEKTQKKAERLLAQEEKEKRKRLKDQEKLVLEEARNQKKRKLQ